jgi:hypothetical protein
MNFLIDFSIFIFGLIIEKTVNQNSFNLKPFDPLKQ